MYISGGPDSPRWTKYEDVAAHLLDRFAAEFGLDRVERKQLIQGETTGTQWEIDAKGVRESDGGIMVVECRRYNTSKLKQEHLAALAFRILDLGAIGGIVVSPLDLQSGAKKVAEAMDIISVQLRPDSTPDDFAIGFLNKFRAGKSLPLFLKGEAAEPDERNNV